VVIAVRCVAQSQAVRKAAVPSDAVVAVLGRVVQTRAHAAIASLPFVAARAGAAVVHVPGDRRGVVAAVVDFGAFQVAVRVTFVQSRAGLTVGAAED